MVPAWVFWDDFSSMVSLMFDPLGLCWIEAALSCPVLYRSYTIKLTPTIQLLFLNGSPGGGNGVGKGDL